MNPGTASLIEKAHATSVGRFSSTGALVVLSGAKTGRSPKDKRIVKNEESEDIWWGDVNMPLSGELFKCYMDYAVDHLSSKIPDLHMVDAYAGWDPKHRVPVRVYSTNPYHALFMSNMLVTVDPSDPTPFEPEVVIYNVGHIPLSKVKIPEKLKDDTLEDTLVALNLSKTISKVVIYGTEYAGEMKKAILTYMMWKMPLENHLTLHSSANIAKDDPENVTFFFGMSGCGKTTLSTDENFLLVGDDEHVWTDHGIFNVEGGCYAKCIGLEEDKEPEIFQAIRFGALLENVVMDELTRMVDYKDISITPNTRASYPLNHIKNVVIPAVAPHPKQIVFLACDASGLLPPVSLLSPDQAEFFFVTGYTSKIPGTEMGVAEPIPTFSACFGEPFLVWSPKRYGELFKEKIQKHNTPVYLLNTGWVEGKYRVGRRIPLKYSRKMVEIISKGGFEAYEDFPVFDLQVPTHVPGVPVEILNPLKHAQDPESYIQELKELYKGFQEKLEKV